VNCCQSDKTEEAEDDEAETAESTDSEAETTSFETPEDNIISTARMSSWLWKPTRSSGVRRLSTIS
jgi:hypothetical protein